MTFLKLWNRLMPATSDSCNELFVDTAEKRWLLVYNCLHVGLKNCLTLLNPQLQVDVVDIASFSKNFDTYRGRLEQYDLVITTPNFVENECVDFRKTNKVHALPMVYFDAYHPDLCYVTVAEKILKGPMYDYHSKIITAAYKNKVKMKDVLSLFNGKNYEAFGFLNLWENSKRTLLDSYAKTDTPIDGYFNRWNARESFMHSVNHPTIRVLFDIARVLLEKNGMTCLKSEFLPQDNLIQAPVYPVYNEIAESLSIPGSYFFKPHGQYRYLNLSQFIELSYQSLSSYQPEAIDVFPMFRSSLENISRQL